MKEKISRKRSTCDHSCDHTQAPYPYLGNDLSSEEKVQIITHHFEEILKTLGMNLEDDSLKTTPQRVAKMYVHELFSGLCKKSFPRITTQENKFAYHTPLTQSRISIHSVCEHHLIPILGHCHIAYIPNSHVIGLSKLNRIAQHYARRPQVQERLTKQIAEAISTILETPDVAVVIDALHLCVRMRGIQDQDALTRTVELSGKFLESPLRQEFLDSLPKLNEMQI